MDRDIFNSLTLYGKAFAGSMIENCTDTNEKNRLTNEITEEACDDTSFLLYVQKEENWPIFKAAFISLYGIIPACTKRYLFKEIVARLQLEEPNLTIL
jgi:hypothetical protein